MILLDTHTWIWWVNDITKLSESTEQIINKAAAEKNIYISSISVWVVALLVGKNKLKLNMDVATWISYSEGLSFVTFVPVNNRIALRSVALPLHSDPADRLIVATALHLGSSLVTKDKKLEAYGGVKTVW